MLGINENQVLNVWYDPEVEKYWVSIKTPQGRSIVREKTFSGETAWSDTERYANDFIYKVTGSYQQAIQL